MPRGRVRTIRKYGVSVSANYKLNNKHLTELLGLSNFKYSIIFCSSTIFQNITTGTSISNLTAHQFNFSDEHLRQSAKIQTRYNVSAMEKQNVFRGGGGGRRILSIRVLPEGRHRLLCVDRK